MDLILICRAVVCGVRCAMRGSKQNVSKIDEKNQKVEETKKTGTEKINKA